MATIGAETAAPSVLTLETAALSTWPALRVVHDGHWLWRWANGYTKRANSLNFLDPSDGADAAARLDHAAALSLRNDIGFVVRSSPLTPPEVLAELDRRGFEVFEESLMLWRRLDGAAAAADPDVTIGPADDPAWLEAQSVLSGYSSQARQALAAILGVYGVPAWGLTLVEDGVPAASALLAIASGVACLTNVVTDPAKRRRGFAARMLGAAMAKAAREGASIAAHAVIATNEPARALYAGTGYRELYRYRYHRPSC
ncbi:GNAT family N-acetyltransferase [Methyloraptor flagellatus]|uniref:GNAT family N-acetyltransferase n=1 Tax=Methyloraptor flagellatus TaxID=3162530 RepID=A0AAU7X8U3_9HYPH